ncbi:MAG: DUF4954 family protein [Cytophagales bacterium]|nr:DUF4954 family protein [Bernardetiaceae bacterium]MDW8210116.1 DUF4954 family protein [Cytophagales bacterium]
MNRISKFPIEQLGYNFIPAEYLPQGKDEYYLRFEQNSNGNYRHLSAYEIELLVRNNNTSDNWNQIWVSEAFDPRLVKNCQFFGLIRIGKLEPYYLEYHNLRMRVGLYNSVIISCDIGDNVVIDNVNYLSHYIIGNEVILANVNEMATTNHAKFGNGILKEGEPESIRIWLEVCNENGGRKILPFNGMLPGDAWMWTRNRHDRLLMEQFKEMTLRNFSPKRGFYGKVGDRCIIKNTKIIKDVNIGSDVYIKGANKLKNLTINSTAQAPSQIGEGCELVNGIIGEGCRIFYGVKAVRFVMASHSQLKYGARLINSYLGNNAVISCCEVLNSLIFPAHEQHHNNSFLCAALLQGQSNMAAGATIGSNHNSRAADGEVIAGRGFWPGLCTSVKHNSVFACYTLLAKSDFHYELHIPLPFSLVSNDLEQNRLLVMPGYWFFHNLYALARNTWKYLDRDKRIDKTQLIEYHYLAPDTINQMMHGLDILAQAVGTTYLSQANGTSQLSPQALGHFLLQHQPEKVQQMTVLAQGFENSRRPVVILKAAKAYALYRELIRYHLARQIVSWAEENRLECLSTLLKQLPPSLQVEEWDNVGGQLIPRCALNHLFDQIRSGQVTHWEEVHQFYRQQAATYPTDKFKHAIAVYEKVFGNKIDSEGVLVEILQKSIATSEKIMRGILESRKKDYENPFRKLVYANEEEMNQVIGSLSENSFIQHAIQEHQQYRCQVEKLLATATIEQHSF